MAPPGEVGGVTRPGALGPGMGPTGGGSFEFTAQIGSLALSGFAGTYEIAGATFTANTGALTLAGFTGDYVRTTNLALDASMGALALTGNSGFFDSGAEFDAQPGTLSLQGYAGTQLQEYGFESQIGAVELAGFAGIQLQEYGFEGTIGTVSTAGFAATVAFGTGLAFEASIGALNVQGFAADYAGITSLDLTATMGAVTLAGFAGTFDRSFVFENQIGAATLAGFSGDYVGSQHLNLQSRIGSLQLRPSKAILTIAGYVPPVVSVPSGVRHRTIVRSRYPRRVKILGKWHVAQSLEGERKLLHEELIEQRRQLEEEELAAQIKTVTKRRIRYTTSKLKSLDAEKVQRLRELDRQLIALLAA